MDLSKYEDFIKTVNWCSSEQYRIYIYSVNIIHPIKWPLFHAQNPGVHIFSADNILLEITYFFAIDLYTIDFFQILLQLSWKLQEMAPDILHLIGFFHGWGFI